VSYLGLAARATAQPLFELAIGAGDAVMLANVFRPGAHNERFEITAGDLEVSANSPARRPIAAPDASVLAHGLDKFRDPLGSHVVFNRDQDRAAIGIGDKRQAPVIPSR
jgi:hypothetical protein